MAGKAVQRRAKRCKTKGCGNEERQRGRCSTCYSVVYRRVRAGELTWLEAEELGLVDKSDRTASPMHEEITRAIRRSQKAKAGAA